jgi:D-alanyl-D-alanine carboxypeptidase
MHLRRLALAFALAFALVVPALAGVATPAHAGISARITDILADNGFGGSRTAVSVWTDGARRAVYARHTTTLLVPASNMKLVTSTTALFRWGPDHRFKTELYLPAAYAAQPYAIGVIRGDIYLKGYGDPSLSMPAFQKNRLHIKTSSVLTFVGHLKALGVTRINGRVIGDATWFDDKKTVASWKPGLKDDCGPLSALSVNEGLRNGERVDNPPRYAARRLLEALEDAGIEVAGGARAGAVPDDAYLTVTVQSATLKTLLKPLNKDSDNFFAEMLVKGLGRDFRAAGTTAAGLRVSRATMRALGLTDEMFRLADGSGLSYQNRLSAAGIAKLLRVMTTRADYTTFYASLSIAGRDGTLRKRMRDTAAEANFRGKTGTLRIASNLSGYVTSAAGHRVIVAMLMNGDAVNTWYAHRAQDRIAVALAKSGL